MNKLLLFSLVALTITLPAAGQLVWTAEGDTEGVTYMALERAPPLQVVAGKILTNDRIVKMVQEGLSDDIIITFVETSEVNFDISATAAELTQQGVSSTIISAMITASANPKEKSQRNYTVLCITSS